MGKKPGEARPLQPDEPRRRNTSFFREPLDASECFRAGFHGSKSNAPAEAPLPSSSSSSLALCSSDSQTGCSLFLPQCHLSPITRRYANSSASGAPGITAVIPQIDSSAKTCARWLVVPGRSSASFQSRCAVYPSLGGSNNARVCAHKHSC